MHAGYTALSEAIAIIGASCLLGLWMHNFWAGAFCFTVAVATWHLWSRNN